MAQHPTIKENWRGKGRWGRLADWCNQIAKWFNRLAFEGPIEEDRSSGQWILRHSPASADAGDVDDADCRVVGQFTGSPPAVSEGAEAADTTAVDPGSSTTYVRAYAMTRVAYYHAGDKKLYGYVRALTFDQYGHLQRVGAETRVEIDATEACN